MERQPLLDSKLRPSAFTAAQLADFACSFAHQAIPEFEAAYNGHDRGLRGVLSVMREYLGGKVGDCALADGTAPIEAVSALAEDNAAFAARICSDPHSTPEDLQEACTATHKAAVGRALVNATRAALAAVRLGTADAKLAAAAVGGAEDSEARRHWRDHDAARAAHAARQASRFAIQAMCRDAKKAHALRTLQLNCVH